MGGTAVPYHAYAGLEGR